MASYNAAIARAVAIELREKVLDLYIAVLPIFQQVGTWTLNGLDPALPAPFDVKVQLDAYKALTLNRLQLTEWVMDLQTAAPGDTLDYPPPPPPTTGMFDGSATFDGTTTFDGEP